MEESHSLYIMHLDNLCTLVRTFRQSLPYIRARNKINVMVKENSKDKEPQKRIKRKRLQKKEGNIISRGRLLPSGCVYQYGFQSQSLLQNGRGFLQTMPIK